MGELVLLEQIMKDARTLDRQAIAIGPFTRLDAGAVAAQDDKTRGAITNLYGSQAAFQADTMGLALSAGNWIEEIVYPAPADFATAEEWIDAFFAGQSARGPRHGAKPRVDYGFLWALWLSALPYGLWSEKISGPSMKEHTQWLERLEGLFRQALDHFDMSLREGTTADDLVAGAASLIEGVWLNQCLTAHHPRDPAEPIATVLRRAGLLLWLGATAPRSMAGSAASGLPDPPHSRARRKP